MEYESIARLCSFLAGGAVRPAVSGVTFVDPALFPGEGCGALPPAEVLARLCAELRLDFAFVPSWEPWAADAVGALRGVGVASLWVSPGVLWPALESIGLSAGLRLVARDPEELASALDVAAEAARFAVRAGLALDADGIVVADDLAGAAGPITPPAFLRASVFPRLATVALLARETGVPVLLHCDGAAERLYGDMRAAGFAGVHGDFGGPGRVEAALIAARSAGLGLVGGLSAAELTDVAAGMAAGRRIAALARRGGLAIADDGGVSTPAGCAALVAALGVAGRP